MPTYSRRTLRQHLGQFHLHDTIVSNTDGSWGVTVGSTNISDASRADPTASSESLYQRNWLRLLGSAGQIQDLRVGSFNTGSGTFLSAVTLATTVFSGMPYELHAMVDPADKDRALDEVIKHVRVRQEVPIWAIDHGHFYSLGPDIQDIIDLRYLSQPTDSLNLGEHAVQWWKTENTGSGVQLRINPSLPASYQLIIDALVTVSLGSGDLATVNIPDEDTVLWGAAAQCFWFLESRAPGQEATLYKARRQEAAREYTKLSRRFMPVVTRRIQLDLPDTMGLPWGE